MTVSLELLGRGPSRPDLLDDLVLAEPDLTDALARWSVPAPVTVPADADVGLPALDAVAETLAAGTAAVVDVAAGLGRAGGDGAGTGGASGASDAGGAADHLVDLLAVAAHSGVGFGSGLVPRCASADEVWALLSGAVAAMTGADVRAALAAPDPQRLLGLSRSAREAVRDVVTCVVVPDGDAERVAEEMRTAVGPGAG